MSFINNGYSGSRHFSDDARGYQEAQNYINELRSRGIEPTGDVAKVEGFTGGTDGTYPKSTGGTLSSLFGW